MANHDRRSLYRCHRVSRTLMVPSAATAILSTMQTAREAVLVVSLLATLACRAPMTSPTPVVLPAPVVAVPPTVPTELRVYYEPGLFAGGDAQVQVGAFARDSFGDLRGIANVPVSFETDAGVLNVLQNGKTNTKGFAVALLHAGYELAELVIHVQVRSSGLSAVLAIPVGGAGQHPTPAPPPVVP